MLYLPMVLLLGFVFLANFLIKFAEWIGEAVKKNDIFLNIDDLNESLQHNPHTEGEADRAKIHRARSGFKHAYRH